MLFRGRLDPPPGRLALAVAHALDLVEAGDRIANMTGVIEWLLALLWKSKGLRRHPILLPGAQPRRFLRDPRTPSAGGLRGTRSLDVLSGCGLLLLGCHRWPPLM